MCLRLAANENGVKFGGIRPNFQPQLKRLVFDGALQTENQMLRNTPVVCSAFLNWWVAEWYGLGRVFEINFYFLTFFSPFNFFLRKHLFLQDTKFKSRISTTDLLDVIKKKLASLFFFICVD